MRMTMSTTVVQQWDKDKALTKPLTLVRNNKRTIRGVEVPRQADHLGRSGACDNVSRIQKGDPNLHLPYLSGSTELV